MRVLRDSRRLSIRFTGERRSHILDHAEMASMEPAIEETLREPEKVVQPLTDPEAHLYYRFYPRTMVGSKYLCVVVKVRDDDAFLLTAYLTNRVKKGVVLWADRSVE